MFRTSFKYLLFVILSIFTLSVSALAGTDDLIVFDAASSTFQRRFADGSIATSNIDIAKGTVIPVTEDYDGDGKIDIGYWSASTRTWTILRTSDGQELNISIDKDLHKNDLIPIAGQFDQDKRADIALFSPGSGTWFLFTSLNGYENSAVTKIRLGSAGDIPVAADYDGDGITDAAVFRPKTNEWIYRSSSTGEKVIEIFESKPGDFLVPADYTGDGKADLAVYRGESLHGVWYILDSSTHALEKLVFGFKDALPMPMDIDGDGMIDPGFYEDGTWYFYDSSRPRLHTIKFGSAEFSPIASIGTKWSNTRIAAK